MSSSMRFHVPALPHRHVLKEPSDCAYTDKVRKFCNMMMSLGHEVFLYSNGPTDAACTEHIDCGMELPPTMPEFSADNCSFFQFSSIVVERMRSRLQPRDFICIIGGLAQKAIADAFPYHMTVEYGIGYGGVFAPYRVYESQAWRHQVNGHLYGTHQDNVRNFDTVIPNYFEVDDFPLVETKQDYFLFMGRLIERKGYQIAVDVCKQLGKRLIVAGAGTPPDGVEYAGVVGPIRRAELMGNAKAVFVPTQYVEPFGGVAIEANLCGTPVITSDGGAFTETVENGFNGQRCSNYREFLRAAEYYDHLDDGPDGTSLYSDIAGCAARTYSTTVVRHRYQDYFNRLLLLWEDGFYAGKK